MKKRVIALLLVVAMAAVLMSAAGTAPLNATADRFFPGDFDGDGEITSSDARKVLQACAGKYGDEGDVGVEGLLQKEKGAADVDGDGQVTSTDARLILQWVAKKIDVFPDPNLYTGNSFTPGSEKAGEPFNALDEIDEDVPGEVLPDTKQFGLFALTTELNPGLPFNVACHMEENEITALLPAGVDVSAVIPTFTYYGDAVTAAGQPVVSDVTVLDLTVPVTLTLSAQDGSTREVTVKIETLNTGLPSVAVTLEAYAGADVIQKDVYTNATFYLGGGDPATCDYAAADALLVTGKIKGRGNSSWVDDAKKSYTVKLDKKATLLDMSKSKDWALVANYEDRSLLRNKIAEYFATAAGIPYVMKVRPVDVWIDGEYWGTYNLTEKIEIEKDRVNITDTEKPDDEEFTDPAANEVGYLLEFDGHVAEDGARVFDPAREWPARGWGRYVYEHTYYDVNEKATRTGNVYYNPDTDETFFRVPYCNNKWVTIKKPSTENLDANPEMRDYIFKKVMELDCALKNRENDPDTVAKLLDLDSFAKWIIVEELMENTDSSFHSSVYMSLDVGGKFVFGPAWDFDRSAGTNATWNFGVGGLIEGTNWGRYAFSTSAGREALKNAWAQFEANTADWMKAFDAYQKLINESRKLNFERWEILGETVKPNPSYMNEYRTYAEHANQLKDRLDERFFQLDYYILVQ